MSIPHIVLAREDWLDGGHEHHVPDTKDWTWVLERPCPECGFDPAAQGLARPPAAGPRHRDGVVAGAGAAVTSAERPAPGVWSPLEYGCHVRDVHVLFAERLRLMLDEDEPTFANWDQDATARRARLRQPGRRGSSRSS